MATTPTILVVFGITGDLATRKIVPALRHLLEQNLLPDHFSVIGFSRGNLEDVPRFAAHFMHQKGTFEDEAAFRDLAKSISDTEASWGVCANKLFYLAAPPSTYKPILENLASVKLNLPCGGDLGWSWVLIEKPFGINLASAQDLQSLLSRYFKEEQIYRIDHYLFKEIIQGIENFRFSNNLFENTWNNSTIERIDIRLHESIGVEGRGSFYDTIGAFRDVGQNHLLEMLATLLMESPVGVRTDKTREHRTGIIQALAPWTEHSIRQHTSRAQYRGYRNVDGVRKDSATETFFSLKTELILPRWEGVSISMEAGKRMIVPRKEIVVTLKHPKECLMCEVGSHGSNQIIFRLEPNDEIIVHFWIKKPGFDRVLEERTLSFFLYEKETKTQYVEEYAKVLYAAMMGEQRSFVSPDEVEAAWKFTDPIVSAWSNNAVPLAEYEPDAAPVGLPVARYGEIGIVGLGKMGANLARRLIEKRWNVVGFNKTSDATKKLESEGLHGAYDQEEFTKKLSTPRTIWLMVPHEAVDEVLRKLTPLLSPGDTIIDGGNSPYKESIRRSQELVKQGIEFLDVGVSGGPDGARNGACLMVGGKKELYEKYERLFKDLAVENGYGYMGTSGAGHFVKMIHNGIEYGMMQAITEGFTVLKKSKYKLDLQKVAGVYNHGSVIESRLIGWLKDAFVLHGEKLKDVLGSVAHTGEGEWTIETAKELKVKTKIIEEALKFRVESEKNPSYTGKILSALRNQFGGHDIKPKNKKKR